MEMDDILDAKTVAFSADFAAAVAIATIALSFPIGGGLGYLNFGEIVIYTAAFLFGSIVGGLAGGVGAAAADILLGWALWAPITLVGKGIEGFVVGKVSGNSVKSKLLAVALGAPFMIGAYFLSAIYLSGWPYALFSELPTDIIQAVVGAAIAIPISHLLQTYVPQLKNDKDR